MPEIDGQDEPSDSSYAISVFALARKRKSDDSIWSEAEGCFARFECHDSVTSLHRAILQSPPDAVFLTRQILDEQVERTDQFVESVRSICDCGIVLEGDFAMGEQLPGNADAVLSAGAGLPAVISAADAAIRRARSRRPGADDRAFVQSLLDSSKTLMLSIDREMKIREFNRACEITTSLPLGDVYGTSLDELVRDDLSELRETLQLNRGRIFPTSLTLTFLARDGEERVIECSLSPFYDEKGSVRLVVITGVEITEQRQIAEALKESEEAFRTLVESSPDAVCVFSSDDVGWIYANPAAAELLGVPDPEALVGRSVFDFVPDSEKEGARERVDRIVRGEQPPAPVEVRLQRADGTTIWAETVEIPLRYKGQPSLLTISRDQTEKKVLTARMMQFDRMVAVGTLAAGVGHEINNPLAYLTSNIEFAAEEFQRAADEAAELEDLREAAIALDEALDGAFRVRNIVRDLKDLSRAEDDLVVPIDIEDVVESALNIAAHELRTRATIRRDFDTVPLVHGSGGRVRRLLVNILLNAAQAMAEGSPSEREIWVHIKSTCPHVVSVSVTDEGSGIDPEDLKRVFDPFFTTKPVGTGTGLGLTIAQRIADSIGGAIAIESEVGVGTTVTVEFEAITSEVSQDSDTPAPSQQVPIRVLVIDDEPMIGSSVRRSLTNESEVVTVQSGKAALEALEEDADFDACLCDIVMPEMSGEELYGLVEERFPDLARRFVFMTGGAFTDEAARFQREHEDRFIEKPFAAWELREMLYDVASRG